MGVKKSMIRSPSKKLNRHPMYISKQGQQGQQGQRREKQTIYRLGQPISSNDSRGDGLRKGIYGCGEHRAFIACKATGTRRTTRRSDRSKEQRTRLEKWRSENSLRGPERKRKRVEDHQRHRKRGTYRGQNRRRGLPVRGQRTSSNHMTARRRNRLRGSLV